MDQVTRPVSDQDSPPAPAPHQTPAPPGRKSRSFPWGWLLVPLLLGGVGYVGYRLGQDDASSTATAGGGFGGAGSGGAGFSGRSASGGAPQGAGARGTRGQNAGGQNAGGQAGAGTAAGRQGGTAGGAFGAAPGTGRSRAGSQGQTGAGRTGGGTGVTIPVQATAVKEGTLRTERRLTGTVAAAQETTVSARTSGTVTRIAADVGSTVNAGQTVLALSNSDLNTSVESARNALETAQVQLRSQTNSVQSARAQLQQQVSAAQTTLANAEQSLAALQKLAAIGAASRTEVNNQNAQVQAARTTLTTAQANLADNTRAQTEGLAEARLAVQRAQIALNQAQAAATAARVTAPFAGQITSLNVSEGQYLAANSPAFTLVSRQRQVAVNVPTTEAGTLPVGAALTFVVGQQKYPLKVIQNAGAPTGGSVPVIARFTESSPPALGTVGSVVYSAKVASGVLVPSTALQADNDQTYLFTIENGKAQQHEVNVLGQAGTQSAVSGIEAGSQVITQPPTGLLDGASVTTASGGSGRRGGAGGAGGPPPGGMP
ncbi:HlyD family efflux transporter periplasmic adaptor subunit [Deinococcus metallilatus]|uniref:HlyD family efflux transporter periplasmic adaptor subunit n=1 Tax=Deinococcus metallilatus TaxID=1211322 RepID=A0AAJ5JY53_9DEIO|nr:HlyD family efflux transporter periplasmic adaptor subunit [Deinococcus metallilatus]MBB5295389.1 multidrug efflux pump subunit AcrA (membrane-fusion protein) [Deinococcus metallilatus]QBY08081.1 HlyD family efflux transporter periplasmic adaptor subunit [Deinococcus metallilatus]RXJ12974.1 HlyD family efflux transporter periplasmic adaptor subunit [Deinococcus metallilatus]TLK27104.1 HlyD family efflux transporter periplasmic adaptor subunit [Deinococcus metallilatus]GMA16066.1 hypothetica